MQRQTYLLVRASLAQLDTAGAASLLEALSTHPAMVGTSDPGLVVTAAELGLWTGTRFDSLSAEPIAAIAPGDSTWRYASRVRDAIRMQMTPEDAVMVVDAFVNWFGNDFRLWAHASYHDPIRPDLRPGLLALVSREIRYCSHDPEVWRGLLTLSDDAEAIEVELQQRSASQLAAVLG